MRFGKDSRRSPPSATLPCQSWLARLMLSGNTAIFHPLFGFSCSTSIALSFPTSRRGATDLMEGLKAAPCELDGSRKHVTDRLRIVRIMARHADASCAESVLGRLKC